MMLYSLVILSLLPCLTLSFTLSARRTTTANTQQAPHFQRLCLHMANERQQQQQEQQEILAPLDPTISSQFKILTCSSTACAKKSQKLGLDEYALFSGLYERKEAANAPSVTVEETSCLGCCKVGPCVGIEHEDYYGTVALEGMKPNEFQDRVFQK